MSCLLDVLQSSKVERKSNLPLVPFQHHQHLNFDCWCVEALSRNDPQWVTGGTRSIHVVQSPADGSPWPGYALLKSLASPRDGNTTHPEFLIHLWCQIGRDGRGYP